MKISKVTKNWYKLSTKDQHGKKLVWFAPTRAEVRQKYCSWFRRQHLDSLQYNAIVDPLYVNHMQRMEAW